jgi:hypothetical protein
VSPAEAPQSLPDVLAPSSGRLGYGSYGPPQPGILTHRIHVWYIYMVTFTINIPPMLAYIPYMDPMG